MLNSNKLHNEYDNSDEEMDKFYHIAGIKNLSPGLNFPFFLGLIRANAARRFAEDPEFTINAYLDPTNFEKANSNFFVISDIVSFLLNKTSIPLIMSSFVKPFSKRG